MENQVKMELSSWETSCASDLEIQLGGWLQLLLTIPEMIRDHLGMLLLDPLKTKMP